MDEAIKQVQSQTESPENQDRYAALMVYTFKSNQVNYNTMKIMVIGRGLSEFKDNVKKD